MLTTPTPVLYMESLADATKGKVTAAEREAETTKNKEKEATKKEHITTQETKSFSSDSNSEPPSRAQ